MLQQLFKVKQREGNRSVYSFFYFFFLMSSYFVLRPVRDEMGIQAGVENMQWLFTGTFFVMLAVVPIFGYLVKRIPRNKLIPRIYLFFSLNIVGYYVAFQGMDPQVLSIVFFIWLSVFNLFVISLFWSFSADMFNTDQAKRMYGPIAAGGSMGAIVGPSLTSTLVGKIGVLNLLPISALLLGLSTFFIFQLLRTAQIQKRTEMAMPIQGKIWAGIGLIGKSSKLQLLVVFILLFTTISTFLYFQQGHIVSEQITSSASRTRYFGMRDLLVNSLTLILQFFLTAQIIRKWGLVLTLSIVPAISILGFLLLGLHPTIHVLLIFQVAYRALNFALQRPSREILFTAVSSEERYKAKNLIDTAIYRGGDAISGWLFAGLAVLIGSVPLISLLAIPIAVGWCFAGMRLAKSFNETNIESYEEAELIVQTKST